MGPARLLLVALTVAALVLGLPAGLGGNVGASTAQEGQAPESQPVEITGSAYYTHSAGGAAPDILVEEFPPGVVCILVPETCGEQAEQVTGPLGEAVPPPESAPDAPAQPVPPDTLPVATLAGAPRYEAALRFKLPALPAGQRVDRFALHLVETQPTYSLDSPAIRQAVLAAVVSLEEEEPAAEEFAKLSEEHPADDQFLGVEACPLVAPFQEGPNQPAAEVPETDCVLGANGTRHEDGTWEWDLTLAAEAWRQGEMANHGILLRPLTAPNLAFGDPDTSTNEQVTFGLDPETPPTVSAATSEPLAPVALGPEPPREAEAGPAAGGGPARGVGTRRGLPPPPGPAEQPTRTAQTPEVAAAEPSGGEGGARAAGPGPLPQPRTPWWYWLTLPALLAGAYATTRTLTAEPEVAAAGGAGALTRLMQRRGEGP